MPIREVKRRFAASRLADGARSLLDASTLCAIATSSPRGGAHVNTAYFAWSPAFEIVWLSDPSAQHSRNLRRNPSAAIAVYDSRQVWGEPDRGIQLFGRAGLRPRAMDVYTERFPAGEADVAAFEVYSLRPRSLKLFDEAALGTGVFVTAAVGRDGGLTWRRTEVYEP